ncbi:MAG: Hsp20 family protein [Deltaproteobacteria bacterium]|nr:Hsp20 family protein [Deltaproteobacteria bacterium]
MAIVRWFDPFRELGVIQDRMNRLFEESFPKTRGGENVFSKGVWLPPVDIYETEAQVVVTAELAGVDKDNVSIEVKDGVLTIKGERKYQKEVDEEYFHLMEREYGSFKRSFSLPAKIDREKVSASFNGGVLEIILPKKEEVKPKQITIDAK